MSVLYENTPNYTTCLTLQCLMVGLGVYEAVSILAQAISNCSTVVVTDNIALILSDTRLQWNLLQPMIQCT